MTIKTQILDGKTGDTLPYASAVIIDDTGAQLSDAGWVADAQGNITINSDILDTDPNSYVMFSFSGYDSDMYMPGEISEAVRLDQKANLMDPVVVKAVKKNGTKKELPPKPSYAAPLVLGSAAVMTFALYMALKHT
jgi:hypothetical protein